MLKLEGVHAGYGRVEVLRDVSLEIGRGEVVSLVGANGAGKSTILKVISGLLPATGGSVTFDGHDLTKKKPDQIVKLGVCQVPEGRQIFMGLTVRQNLLLGNYVHGTRREELEPLYDYAFELFPVLKRKAENRAGSLSGGEQQMLAIARGLMSKPGMLLLDEPSLGLAPLVVRNIFEIVQMLKGKGMPVLLVEQNVTGALKISDRAYVMETGKIVRDGQASSLLEDDEIRKRYLGM